MYFNHRILMLEFADANEWTKQHYSDVIMSAIAFRINGVSIVYFIAYFMVYMCVFF